MVLYVTFKNETYNTRFVSMYKSICVNPLKWPLNLPTYIYFNTYFTSLYNSIQYDRQQQISCILCKSLSKTSHKENLSPKICGPYVRKVYLISRNSDYLNKTITGPKTAVKYWYSVWVFDNVLCEFFS